MGQPPPEGYRGGPGQFCQGLVRSSQKYGKTVSEEVAGAGGRGRLGGVGGRLEGLEVKNGILNRKLELV